MAATKKQTNRKGTGRSSSGRKNTKKKTTAKQSVTSGFQTEIILLIILAASIILIFSNLGMGGTDRCNDQRGIFWCDGYPCVSVSDSDLRMCGISGFEPQESTGIQKGACGTAILYLSVWTDPASDGRIYAKYDTG